MVRPAGVFKSSQTDLLLGAMLVPQLSEVLEQGIRRKDAIYCSLD